MIVLIDGLSLLYRSFHALPPLSTSTGQPTGGLYGFFSVLLQLLREREPAGFAVALDAPGPTVRHQAVPTYKEGRAPAPEPLRAQARRLRELVERCGLPARSVPGQEADDVLASLAARLPGPVLVVSGDSDLLQLVDDRVTVRFLGQRGRPTADVDPAAFLARHGFQARLLPTFKAMVGDPSDALEGIRGLGRASAKALCAAHGDAAGILAALDQGRIGNRRLPPVLERSREELQRLEALIRLRTDLPLTEPLAAPIDRPGLRSVLRELELRSLEERLG